MSMTAVVLIIIAAILHAGWNFVGKKERPTSALFLVATICGGICLLPVILYFFEQYRAIPVSVLKMVFVTGAFQAFYFGMLAAAYRSGDLSVVYPLARSIPTLLVTGVALIMGTGHAISGICLGGIALIVLGCTVLPIANLRRVGKSDYFNACCCFALFAAIGTAGYMVIDSLALKCLCAIDGQPFSKITAALLYAPLEVLSTAFWLSIYVLADQTEFAELKTVLTSSKKHAFLMGAAIYVAYTLVLVAMNFSGHVSYVMAFRQLSIPIGSIMGMVALDESRPFPKKLGIATVSAGLVLVGIG